MATLSDNSTLLLFRVGPVLCCAPSLTVNSIISVPDLTRPPGSSIDHPGIFKQGADIVSVVDLRYRFGVAKKDWQPGRLIIVRQDRCVIGFWVDKILDVIETPGSGWGRKPALIPHGVFTRTLFRTEQIYLYCEFAGLASLQQSGYLKQYIEHLQSKVSDGGQEQQRSDIGPTRLADSGTAETKSARTGLISPKSRQEKQAVNVPICTDKTTDNSMADPDIHDIHSDTQASTHQVSPKSRQEKQAVNVPISTGKTTDNSMADPDIHDIHSDTQASTHQVSPKSRQEKQAVNVPISTGKTNADSDRNSVGVPKKFPTTTSGTTPPRSRSLAQASGFARNPARPSHDKPPPATLRAAVTGNPPSRPEHPARSTPSRTPQDEGSLRPFTLLLIVLLLGTGGAGLYLLLKTPHSTVTPLVPVKLAVDEAPLTTSDPVVLSEEMPVAMEETPIVADESTPQETQSEEIPTEITITETTSPAESDEVQTDSLDKEAEQDSDSKNSTDYQAEIELDEQGITIVLYTPANSPALLQNEPGDDTLARAENASDPARPAKSSALSPLTATVPTPAAPQSVKPGLRQPKKMEIIHIVVKGDTLWAIAARYVHNPYLYPELARLSRIKNPDRIYPGDRVRIIQINPD